MPAWISDERDPTVQAIAQVAIRRALFPGHALVFDEPPISAAAEGWPFVFAAAVPGIEPTALVLRRAERDRMRQVGEATRAAARVGPRGRRRARAADAARTGAGARAGTPSARRASCSTARRTKAGGRSSGAAMEPVDQCALAAGTPSWSGRTSSIRSRSTSRSPADRSRAGRRWRGLPAALAARSCSRRPSAVRTVEAATVDELIGRLDERWPGMRDRLCDAGPTIREHINIFVDGERATLATPVGAALDRPRDPRRQRRRGALRTG